MGLIVHLLHLRWWCWLWNLCDQVDSSSEVSTSSTSLSSSSSVSSVSSSSSSLQIKKSKSVETSLYHFWESGKLKLTCLVWRLLDLFWTFSPSWTFCVWTGGLAALRRPTGRGRSSGSWPVALSPPPPSDGSLGYAWSRPIHCYFHHHHQTNIWGIRVRRDSFSLFTTTTPVIQYKTASYLS